MKVAISSTGEKLTDNISEFFGRCPYFVIVEIDNQEIGEMKVFKNENENQTGGAGILAAQFLAEKNINAVIARSVGPRAMDVLEQFNIGMYEGEGIIKKSLQKFINNKLNKIN